MKLIILALIISLASCSSTLKEDDCEQIDWLNQGKKDAGQGLSASMFLTYKSNCLADKPALTERQLYSEGYKQGITNYCNYRIGRLLGSSGSSINKVCDLKKYSEFHKGYKEGLKLSKKKALPKKGANPN